MFVLLELQVMDETNTLINWPARLKIGARSKKGQYQFKILTFAMNECLFESIFLSSTGFYENDNLRIHYWF